MKNGLSIVLDVAARRSLAVQLEERNSKPSGPVRWHELLDSLSREISGYGAGSYTIVRVLLDRAVLYSWHPSLITIFIAILNKKVVYLCWGTASYSGIKRWFFKLLLRNVSYILVNDLETQMDIRALCGRQSSLVPFFVDTNYFSFWPLKDRTNFIFCNGSNDRDPEFLLKLADAGENIVWLVNEPILIRRYSGAHPNLLLRTDITFDKLRSLYQTSKAVIIPIISDLHCAGQTTCMEAVACGAPVLISTCRTASIFQKFPSVVRVSSMELGDWIIKLKEFYAGGECYKSTAISRELLCESTSREKLKSSLLPFNT